MTLTVRLVKPTLFYGLNLFLQHVTFPATRVHLYRAGCYETGCREARRAVAPLQ